MSSMSSPLRREGPTQNTLGCAKYKSSLMVEYRDPHPVVADLFWSQSQPGCYLVRPDNLIWKIPTFSDSGIYIDQDYVKEQSKLRASEETITNDIWGDKEVVDWFSSSESAILVVSGTLQSIERPEKFSVEMIDYSASNGYTTFHLLGLLPSEVYERSTIRGSDAVRQLAIQSLRLKGCCREASYTNTVLAEVMHGFKAINIEEWFDCLTGVLADYSRVAIVVDIGSLKDNFEDAGQWPAGFSNVIQELKGKAVVKVMIFDGRPINILVDSIMLTVMFDRV